MGSEMCIRDRTQAGGIGIRYQANEDDLKEYLFVEMEKALDQSRKTKQQHC